MHDPNNPHQRPIYVRPDDPRGRYPQSPRYSGDYQNNHRQFFMHWLLLAVVLTGFGGLIAVSYLRMRPPETAIKQVTLDGPVQEIMKALIEDTRRLDTMLRAVATNQVLLYHQMQAFDARIHLIELWADRKPSQLTTNPWPAKRLREVAEEEIAKFRTSTSAPPSAPANVIATDVETNNPEAK